MRLALALVLLLLPACQVDDSDDAGPADAPDDTKAACLDFKACFEDACTIEVRQEQRCWAEGGECESFTGDVEECADTCEDADAPITDMERRLVLNWLRCLESEDGEECHLILATESGDGTCYDPAEHGQ